jgi:hypothetical protein
VKTEAEYPSEMFVTPYQTTENNMMTLHRVETSNHIQGEAQMGGEWITEDIKRGKKIIR